jgi:hypothetical protein
MGGKSTSFEIHVLRDKRWVLTEIVGDEANAVQFADNLLNKSNYEAVRVIRDFARLDGMHSETVVHEKVAVTTKPEINLVPVADAPICNELADAYALPARLTIGRLFRKYLDEALITPTELLHNPREMKRLGDKGRLLMSAVDTVATLQAPGGGEEAKARRDLLHKGWDQLFARARRATPEKPPKLSSFKELLAAAEKGPEDRDFQCLVLMTLQLLDLRGWLPKLERILSWLAEDGAMEMISLFDGLAADLLMPTQAIQDLLGYQPNLGHALCQLCDLAEGRAEPAKFSSESFVVLNRLFAEGKLQQAQEALLTRVTRELRSTNLLSRNEPDREYEMFVQVVNRLVGYRGVVGGAAMADSILQRCIRQQNMGGVAGALYAIDEVLQVLGDGCRSTLFLLSLAATPREDPEYGPAFTKRLSDLARTRDHIDRWVPLRLPPRERMAAVTACNLAVCKSTLLSDAVKTQLASRTDTILASYLEEGKVIEKIDNPEDPLAFRALRLVKFCASGVLISGKSLAMAHQRVLDHLRQPQFEEKFLASIPDPVQAEKHLREFHRLLVESGFGS